MNAEELYRQSMLLHDLKIMRLFGKRVATLEWLDPEEKRGVIAALAYIVVETYEGTPPEKFEEYLGAGIDGEYQERRMREDA